MRFADLAADLRFAIRQLRRAPGFAAIVVATLALGVGANSAVFALADAALLRPLPFAEPDRLVMVWERRGDASTGMPSPLEAREWSQRVRSFETLTTFAVGATVTMAGPDGLAVLLQSMTVNARFFDVLGVPPVLGRTFRDEDVTAAPTAIVLSENMWRARFAADPAIVGRAVVLGGRAMTVVGVMPAHVQVVPPVVSGATSLMPPPELWTVASFESRGAINAHYVHVVGRLRKGVPLETAQLELDGIARDMAASSPAQKGHGVLVRPLRDALIGTEVRRTSVVLLGVVGFLLVMCCANLANLLLARTAARARELAVRSALGAARRRIIVQLLVESLTLAVLGGAAGALVAVAVLRAAGSIVPPGLLPNAVAIPFDSRVALFCGVITLAVGVGFGLAPAWQATGVSLGHAGATGRASHRGRWLSHVLIGAEVAAAVLVVSGSGLLLRTWSALGRVDPGFQAEELFTAVVNLPFPQAPQPRYPDGASVRRFQQVVERELARQPQVRRVAWGNALPLDGGGFAQTFRIVGAPVRSDRPADFASYHMVSPSYFETLGIAIVRGRGFTPLDTAAALPVCVVSEAFVRRHLAGRDPIGARIEMPLMAFGPPRLVVREIVGVARQVKSEPGEVAPAPQLYVPVDQNSWWAASLLVEPTSGRADALAPIVRAAIGRADASVAPRLPRTMARVASDATARPRFRAVLVSAFGALGLLLAMVGVFGVLAHAVSRRTQELGIRLALGARPRQVVAMVAGSVVRSVSVGTAAGLILAALLVRSMTTFLFGIEPLDPLTFAGAAAVLAITAAAAAAIPSLRAARVDPVTAFRSE